MIRQYSELTIILGYGVISRGDSTSTRAVLTIKYS